MNQFGFRWLVGGIILIGLFAGCSSSDAVEVSESHPEPTSPSLPTATAQVLPSPQPTAEEEEQTALAPEELIPVFEPSSPVSEFAADDIELLGVDCQGGPREIADCILAWQEKEMFYCSPDQATPDCTDPIRMNYVLPGLYSSEELIRERQSGGSVYGICFDFAAIYCSIARYYGLDCRVVNSISKPSEREGTYVVVTKGMAEEEYQRWKPELDKEGLDYPYEVLRLIAEETPGHYWAEVKLDGEWVIRDGTRAAVGGDTQSEYKDTGDFQITDWMASEKSQAAYEYAVRIAQGEDLRGEGYDSASEQFMEGREVAEMSGTAEAYQGVEDDLGQPGRSASVDDFFQGLGLMPYFDTCQDTCAFLEIGEMCSSECQEEDQIKACYEDCAGEPYYLACMYIEQGEDVSAEAYQACSGVPLNVSCEAQCAD